MWEVFRMISLNVSRLWNIVVLQVSENRPVELCIEACRKHLLLSPRGWLETLMRFESTFFTFREYYIQSSFCARKNRENILCRRTLYIGNGRIKFTYGLVLTDLKLNPLPSATPRWYLIHRICTTYRRF